METGVELLRSFRGSVSPPPVSATYQLGLVVAALAMVLLPAVYVALMGLVGYGVYYHAVNDVGLLEQRSVQIKLIGYFAPLVAGGTLLLFMVIPSSMLNVLSRLEISW